jgi:DNA gyrase subunit A
MRYTEAKMAPITSELLRDLDKNTVRFSCNYDDKLTEPDMLPGRFPNLLVNGASGIAVGLATNIPPHNLGECIDGVVAYIDNHKITLKEMMRIIKGPDFPTGGFIIAGDELVKAYETGRGKIIMRAKLHIEVGDNDKRLIIIDELPYQTNKATLLENIAKVRDEKKEALSGILDITDESDRNGMRAVIKIKKEIDPKDIVEKLFKYTNLSTTFGINMVAIADGKPQTMGLLEIIGYYVNYQREVILRRSKFELDAAKEREHILEGLVIAVKNIDEVIKIIRASQTTGEARDKLRTRFTLSERQAQAILDLRLARLTALEVYKLEQELKDVRATIERLTAIIASKKLQMDLVKAEMLQIKKSYKTPRRSVVLKELSEYNVPSDDDEKPIEDYYVAFNANNQLKKMLVKNFMLAQKDYSDSTTRNEICYNLIKMNSRERLWCFTNLGNCYKIDAADIPDGKWKEKGQPLQKVVSEALENEHIVYMRNIEEALPSGNLLFYTKEGMVKKSAWSEYNVVKSSFQAHKLKEGDEVLGIQDDQKNKTLLFITKLGMCLNAEMNDIPLQGRIAAGVKGIALNDGDECVMIRMIDEEGEVAIVTDRGFGKRIILSDLDIMARYRKGIKIIDFKKDNGDKIVFAGVVKHPYKIVLEICDEGDKFLSAFSTDTLSIENRTHQGRPLLRGKPDVKEVLVYRDEELYG